MKGTPAGRGLSLYRTLMTAAAAAFAGAILVQVLRYGVDVPF